jgi:hypothetical protein
MFTVSTPPPVPSHQPMLDESMYPSSAVTTPASTSAMSSNPNDTLSQKDFVDPHIVYYLNTVLPQQYPIASDSLSSVMRNVRTSS